MPRPSATRAHPLRPKPARAALAVPSAVLAALAALAVPAAGKVYEAVPGESTLTYRLKHPMHLVKGVSRDFTCRVELAPDTLSSRVTVSADVKSFDSGNSSRDDHALEAIKAHRHPRVEFASDSVRKAEGDAWRVHGKLTFAGTTRPVEFLVTAKRAGGKVAVGGGFGLKLTDYGVKPPSLMFIRAEDRLEVRFDLVAKDE